MRRLYSSFETRRTRRRLGSASFEVFSQILHLDTALDDVWNEK